MARPLAAGSTLFAVSGVAVNVRAENAAMAKTEAIIEAQVKAFKVLSRRLGDSRAVKKTAKLSRNQVGEMLDSLSIEQEQSGPGQYIAKLTIRFLPGKVRATFNRLGIRYIDRQAGKTVVLPVWNGPQGLQIWTDNPWRKAWLELETQNGIVPVVVPLGDLTDSQTLTPQEVLQEHHIELEAIRMRYKADAILIAMADPVSENSIHATMTGESPVGELAFDKTYESDADNGNIADVAREAAQRFYGTMVYKWKKRIAPRPVVSTQATPAQTVQAGQNLRLSVPFSGLDEWSRMRSQMLSVPSVKGVNATSMTAGGAIVNLRYDGQFADLQTGLLRAGLGITNIGGSWVVQPY